MIPFIARTRVLPEFPYMYRVRHQEVEPPYRASPRALVVRLPKRRALVFGWWRRTGLDEDGALAAIGIGGHRELSDELKAQQRAWFAAEFGDLVRVAHQEDDEDEVPPPFSWPWLDSPVGEPW